MKVLMYLFLVHFCPCPSAFFFLCSRLFGDTCIHGSTDLFRPSFDHSLLLFSSPSLFSSRHALILSRSVLIYCGILYFELRLRVLTRFCVDNMTVYATLYTLITISISVLTSPTKPRTHCAGVSESRRKATYRPDDNTLKKRKRWARSRRCKFANRNPSHSLSARRDPRDLTKWQSRVCSMWPIESCAASLCHEDVYHATLFRGIFCEKLLDTERSIVTAWQGGQRA